MHISPFWFHYFCRTKIQTAELKGVPIYSLKGYLKVTSPPNILIYCDNLSYCNNFYQQLLKAPISQHPP